MASEVEYRLTEGVFAEMCPTVPAGTTLLVVGEAACREGVVASALRADAAEGALLVTDRDRESALAACGAEHCWSIACAGEPSERGAVVPSPVAVPEMATEFARTVRRAERDGVTRLRVGIELLDDLLAGAEPALAFRFLHLLTGRVRTGSHLAVAGIDPARHDRATVSNTRALFDGVLELREGDGGREARLSGLDRDGPTAWTPV